MTTDASTVSLRRARHVVIWWEEDKAICLCAATGASTRIAAEAVEILAHSDQERPASQIARDHHVPSSVVRQLIAVGALEPHDKPVFDDGWTTPELAMQCRTGQMPQPRSWPSEDLFKATEATAVPLSARSAQTANQIDFASVLRTRRSVRTFMPGAVRLEQVSELLHVTLGVQQIDPENSAWFRPTPSGGARHSLEVYLLAIDIDGLPAGTYHYDPRHRLTPHATDAAFRDQLAAALGRDASNPAGFLLITSRFARTMSKYGAFGLSLIHKDTGALMQTLYLQLTAMHLGGYAIGGGHERAIAQGLALDPLREGFVGAFAFGQPERTTP